MGGENHELLGERQNEINICQLTGGKNTRRFYNKWYLTSVKANKLCRFISDICWSCIRPYADDNCMLGGFMKIQKFWK